MSFLPRTGGWISGNTQSRLMNEYNVSIQTVDLIDPNALEKRWANTN